MSPCWTRVKRVTLPDYGSAPQRLRMTNALKVLHTVWDAEPFTASEVMARTALTRSTVHGLCDELADQGWITELDDARSTGNYRKGRPARRYAFHAQAGYLVGIDAGQHRISASVADLRGTELATADRQLGPEEDTSTVRLRVVKEVVAEALERVGTSLEAVLAVVVGVPAPTDPAGASPRGHRDYWTRMNPGLAEAFAHPGRAVVVENDANLSAVAESTVGAGVGVSSFASLLSGERFGAGLIVDGRLLHGRSGGAGELRLLDLVDGVGSADGLGHVARKLARETLDDPGSPTVLRAAVSTGGPRAEEVFAAAVAGDEAAQAIVATLADRLARVCAVVATMLDLERIVVAGAIASALGAVVARAEARLEHYVHPPVPRIIASELGSDVVRLGAIHRALALVKQDPLSFRLRGACQSQSAGS